MSATDETVLKARKILAAQYKKRNMDDAAAAVKKGAWDGEPMMLAVIDALQAA